MTEGSAPSSPRRGRIIPVVIAVLLAGGIAYFATNSGVLDGPRRVVDRVWITATAAGPRVLLLTETEFTRFGRRRTRRFERYELQTHDARSAALLKRAVVAELEDVGGSPTVEVVGVTGDRIWLWRGEIEARDCNSLEVVATTDQIRAANPRFQLGRERAFYGVGPDPADLPAQKPPPVAAAGLAVRTLDGRFYHIDSHSLSATELTASPVHDFYGQPKKLTDWFYSVSKWPPGFATPVHRGGSGWGAGLNGAIIDERLIVIASEEERADLSVWFSRPRYTSGDVRRRLFGGAVRRDGNDYAVEPAALTPLTSAEYLVGGFLNEPRNAEQTWVLDGTLMLVSLTQLGEDGRLVVARIRPDGSEIWTAALGIADLAAYGDADSAILFAGYVSFKEPTGLRPYLVVLVDKQTGKVSEYSLREDRALPPQ